MAPVHGSPELFRWPSSSSCSWSGPDRWSSRGQVVQPNLGRAPRPQNWPPAAVGAAVAAVVVLVVLQGTWRAAGTTGLIFAIISLSLVVVTGFAGQISLAQLTLAGVAAFSLSPITESWGIPFPIAPLLAALAATVIGVVVGLPRSGSAACPSP